MPNQKSRGEIQDLLEKLAVEDPQFRSALIMDPKSVIQEQLQTALPESINIKVVEETADSIYVIVPYVPTEGELEDSVLDSVGGGFLQSWGFSYHSE